MSLERGGDCQVHSVTGVAGCHHVLGVQHLLGELGNGQGSVLGKWGESGHEEVKSGEGDHVDCEFLQVSVELSREPETGGNSGG